MTSHLPTTATFSALYCTVILVLMVIALLRGKRPTEHILLLALGLLTLGGLLSPTEALKGFANEGMASVALLFIVSEGLTRQGGLRWFVQWMLRARYLRGQLLRMSSVIVALSSILNNTAVVAMFIPEIKQWAEEHKISPSLLLIPLSYAAILGGTCTLIGTSTNLLVAGMVKEQLGLELSMLTLSGVGIPVALAGIMLMITTAPWLLPKSRKNKHKSNNIENLLLAARVPEHSILIGRRLDEISAQSILGLFPVEITRHHNSLLIPAPSRDTRLMANDLLIFAGRARALVELCNIEGLELEPQHKFRRRDGLLPGQTIEVVLTPSSPLIGQEIGNGRFRKHYDAAVLAISREGQLVEPDHRQRWTLSVGDKLLIEMGEEFLERAGARDFILLQQRPREETSFLRRMCAMGLVVMMVILGATGALSIFKAALLTVVIMVFGGMLNVKDALKSVDTQVVLTIAAAIGVGQAVENAGLARMMTSGVLMLGGDSPMLALVMVYLTASLLTQLMTNNAAVVLVLPFALTLANTLDVSVMPFIITIMFAASASFATPFGYQTNLMVYGAGNYTMSDFLRIGLPMNILCAILVLILVPLFFPF